MAITYTDNLGLPVVPADWTANWDVQYNAMIEKLDRNPGNRIVADETAMNALTTFAGRVCFRADVAWYYYYNGTAWAEWPKLEEAAAYMAMADTAQEETAEVAAAEGTEDGTIDFAYFPDLGAEIQLYMLQVQPEATAVAVTDESVTLGAETPAQLAEKHDRSVDATGDEVDDIVVKDIASSGEVQTLSLGGADGGTFKLGTDLGDPGEVSETLNWNDNAATIETALETIFGAGNVTVAVATDFTISFAIDFGDSGLEFADIDLTNATSPGLTLDTAAPVIYILNTDYAVDVDATGYTTVARIATGSITDSQVVLVDYAYQPGVTGFKLQLFSEGARTNLMYELDTSEDDTWVSGAVVRDPNYGLKPISYFIDEDDNGQMYYTVTNLDATLASKFLIDIKYKALT